MTIKKTHRNTHLYPYHPCLLPCPWLPRSLSMAMSPSAPLASRCPNRARKMWRPPASGSPAPWITKSLPNEGHCASSHGGPPMGNGVGAAPKAPPAHRALVGLPLLLPPLLLGECRGLGYPLPTLGTLLGALPSVYPLMGVKSGFFLKGLPTLSAVEGPLFCVNLLMLEETVSALKLLPTLRTLIVPLPSVGGLVGTQAASLPEAFPTFPARVGSLSGVDPLVINQGGALAEAFPTFSTLVGPLPSMDPLVHNQGGALPEAFPTFSTLEGPFPGVGPLVDHQHGVLHEALPTF
uniref:Uncharacterized protein n=1 Tax=Taeniopygia guttata TaxID=59729 RepID=A0A674GR09_TAEGU